MQSMRMNVSVLSAFDLATGVIAVQTVACCSLITISRPETCGCNVHELETCKRFREDRGFRALVSTAATALCQDLMLVSQPDHVRHTHQARLSLRLHLNPLFLSPVGRSRLATRRILDASTRKRSPWFTEKESL